MTNLKKQMLEDKAIRDAAKALIDADVDNLRTNFSNKGMAARAIERLSEGAADVYEEASSTAKDNKGALAAIVAALALWFARNPLSELIAASNDEIGSDVPADELTASQDPVREAVE